MLIYSFAIWCYKVLLFLVKPFNKKAALLYAGRNNTKAVLKAFNKDHSRELAWFHCASLGEFEQARPVLEQLKQGRNMQIAISFFSPSGYEVRKDYKQADVVFYLPSDSSKHATFVLNRLKPERVFFVKYEIWVHYINAIAEWGIPLYLLSATFRPNHIYFRWYGRHLKHALKKFTHIFTQDKSSLKLLADNGISTAVFSNDTRYDRVYENCQNVDELSVIKAFKGDKKMLVLGSSYAAEEGFIPDVLEQFPELKIVVAPHNIDEKRIMEIINLFSRYVPVRYSQAEGKDLSQFRVLIIDNIGLLSSVYQYADLAFIGGGFASKGIHNTLEAATFGMPVFIGPNNHARFPEIALLKEYGVLYTVSTVQEFQQQLSSFLTNDALINQVKVTAQNLIKSNTGATAVIFKYLV